MNKIDRRSKILRPAVAVAGALLLTALAAGMADGSERTRVLTGRYEWSAGGSAGPLEARFTPREEGGWNVAFHFEFSNRPHTYTGVAEGDLDEGRLEGEVRTENGRRTFTFQGRFQGGSFRGTHAEGGSRTGTLTLKRAR